MNILKLAIHWQILMALVLAVIVGLLTGTEASIFGILLIDIFGFFGTLFLNALKMIIVPLIMASIISGIAGLGGQAGFGRLGGKTVIYYAFTSFVAIMIGLLMVNIFAPGIVDGEPARHLIGLDQAGGTTADLAAKVGDRGPGDIVDVFLRMVPTNVVAAAANGQMLGLIFFSLLFGYFMTQLKPDAKKLLLGFWQSVLDVMMMITDWVMKFAPIGVFALVAKIVATTGVDAFVPLAVFFFTVLAALAIHFFVVLPLMLKFIAGVSPVAHFKAMMPAILTAFSTSSSAATLPVTLECVEKNAGVSNRTTSFVLPLGATINMDGTALYECVAAMFIAQVYGLELGFTTQFTVVLIALLTSIGVAGIPSASLVAITIILAAIGLPLEAVALILAVDRVLDMCRTSVNVFSDSCGAVIIGRLEGEKNILKN